MTVVLVVALFVAGTLANWLPRRPSLFWQVCAACYFLAAVLVCIIAGAVAATSSLLAGVVWFAAALALYVYFRADLGLDRRRP